MESSSLSRQSIAKRELFFGSPPKTQAHFQTTKRQMPPNAGWSGRKLQLSISRHFERFCGSECLTRIKIKRQDKNLFRYSKGDKKNKKGKQKQVQRKQNEKKIEIQTGNKWPN